MAVTAMISIANLSSRQRSIYGGSSRSQNNASHVTSDSDSNRDSGIDSGSDSDSDDEGYNSDPNRPAHKRPNGDIVLSMKELRATSIATSVHVRGCRGTLVKNGAPRVAPRSCAVLCCPVRSPFLPPFLGETTG